MKENIVHSSNGIPMLYLKRAITQKEKQCVVLLPYFYGLKTKNCQKEVVHVLETHVNRVSIKFIP